MATKVRYLVDTNIWLELLLKQEKSDVVSEFLTIVPPNQLFVSDFAIHSIGVILSRLKKKDFKVVGLKKKTPQEIVNK